MTTPLHPPGLNLPDAADVRWRSFTKAIRFPEEHWPVQIYDRPMIVGRVGKRAMALVADPDAAKTILTGPEARFPKWRIYARVVGRGAGYENISSTGGAKCQHLRRALAPVFGYGKLPALTPGFRKAAERAAAEWRVQGSPVRIDACLEMTRITLDTIWRTMFDADFDKAVAPIVDRVARQINAAQVHNRINEPSRYLAELVEDAARCPHVAAAGNPFARLGNGAGGDDAPDRLTPAELHDNALLFLGAGHETTALTLTWALWLIGQDLAAQARVHDEIDRIVGAGPVEFAHIDRLGFTAQVLRETLRLYAPTPVVVRQAREDVTLAGERLPAGTILAVCIYALHRSTRCWNEPHLFRPDRFAAGSGEPRHRDAFLPFGAGRHVCVGMPFGWTEAMTVFATLLQRFRVVTDRTVPVRPRMMITIRPDRAVPIVLHPR